MKPTERTVHNATLCDSINSCLIYQERIELFSNSGDSNLAAITAQRPCRFRRAELNPANYKLANKLERHSSGHSHLVMFYSTAPSSTSIGNASNRPTLYEHYWCLSTIRLSNTECSKMLTLTFWRFITDSIKRCGRKTSICKDFFSSQDSNPQPLSPQITPWLLFVTYFVALRIIWTSRISVCEPWIPNWLQFLN